MSKDALTNEVQQLIDREKVRECLARIARGEDRRDAELVRASYWPDSTVDFGIFAGPFDKYLAWIVPGSPAVVLTQHFLGQSSIDLTADSALAETLVLSYHRLQFPDAEKDMTIGGRYLDRLEKRAGEWRVAKRTMLYDWYQELGPSIEWSKGLLGTPFSAAHFSGKTTDDFSVRFFASGNR